MPEQTIELKENTVIIVLGASGDLAKKKTFPALFGLVCFRGHCRRDESSFSNSIATNSCQKTFILSDMREQKWTTRNI